MNHKEAKAMEGTEFTYVFEDGDEIRAYVKKYDKKEGLSLFSLDTETRDNWAPDDGVEDDGTFCVAGFPYKEYKGKGLQKVEKAAFKDLKEIEKTGKLLVTTEERDSNPFGNFGGCPF